MVVEYRQKVVGEMNVRLFVRIEIENFGAILRKRNVMVVATFGRVQFDWLTDHLKQFAAAAARIHIVRILCICYRLGVPLAFSRFDIQFEYTLRGARR